MQIHILLLCAVVVISEIYINFGNVISWLELFVSTVGFRLLKHNRKDAEQHSIAEIQENELTSKFYYNPIKKDGKICIKKVVFALIRVGGRRNSKWLFERVPAVNNNGHWKRGRGGVWEDRIKAGK